MVSAEDIKTLQSSALCPKNFICMSDFSAVCKIEYVVLNTIYFILNDQENTYCPFKKNFGGKYCCTCL